MTFPPISLRQALYIAGGMAFTLLLAWALRIDHLRADHLSALTKLKTDIIDRTKEADAKALAAKQAQEAAYAQKANQADATIADLRDQYRAAVLRAKDAQRASIRAIAAARHSDTGIPEAAADPSELCVSDADALKVADLAAYAVKAHEWAMSLEVQDAPR